eukprot:2997183-Rhodomonas_salina.2
MDPPSASAGLIYGGIAAIYGGNAVISGAFAVISGAFAVVLGGFAVHAGEKAPPRLLQSALDTLVAISGTAYGPAMRCPVRTERLVLSAYGPAMQCPVLTLMALDLSMCSTVIAYGSISLRGCYAMSGTDAAYGATSAQCGPTRPSAYAPRLAFGSSSPSVLRACYRMSGTAGSDMSGTDARPEWPVPLSSV